MTRTVSGLERIAEAQIYDHCFERADREVGGVLVGLPVEGGTSVIGAIRAESAHESLATLTFTQETWAHIHRVRDEHYKEYEIVGWYHSHPGHGIFLSDHDLFIHRHFFSDPSQIAYVVDPIAGHEGVFGWRDGEITTWFERATSRRPPERAHPPRPVRQDADPRVGPERVELARTAPSQPADLAGADGSAVHVGLARDRAVVAPSSPPTPPPALLRAAEDDPWLALGPCIYLAVIGLAIGVIVWAVLLR